MIKPLAQMNRNTLTVDNQKSVSEMNVTLDSIVKTVQEERLCKKG